MRRWKLIKMIISQMAVNHPKKRKKKRSSFFQKSIQWF